ncbi:phosphoribosylanthranilate isomerase [Algoriphagus kandeliae]|uniref:N-(5'-phosphoribosyl)anthranilate isomerase n=1 Tax=Algoriphagus kandeliae TaxID=2562278 RepID=A0A4Y9QKR4_9BACT|nr:phosphoribosylanthranilate isomerase [Algoriphagus kandeliae]TFV93279.1 phosphoribosylanthranilate isomerase [Algoriphagus kandeliae]
MEIKVCGMREPENIRSLISDVNPDWMGLIFYPKSPRYVSDEYSERFEEFPVKKVGVFVNESVDEILRKVKLFDLSAIQLHGNEPVEILAELKRKTAAELWKVISVANEINWENIAAYLPYVNKFLFDTASPNHGGTGRKFDWEILKTYTFEKGFLLSGGLDAESVTEIKTLKTEIDQLEGVDLNSKFEDAPGLKNIERIVRFKEKLDHSL